MGISNQITPWLLPLDQVWSPSEGLRGKVIALACPVSPLLGGSVSGAVDGIPSDTGFFEKWPLFVSCDLSLACLL